MSLRAAAREIFDAGLAAARVGPLVRAALQRRDPPGSGRVLVVGMGKASGAMAAAVEEAWGDRIDTGVVAVKDGYGAPTRRVRLLEAGHPVPDGRGAAAASAILDLVAEAGREDFVLVLVSGGGSALAPAPAPPVTLEDKQAITRLLLAAGATIGQINAVRKHCSRLKGGQLARAAAPARVHALVLSDVIGDPLDVVGSGPTVPDASTFADALAVLDRFGLRAAAPATVVDRLRRGAQGQAPETPKPGDPLFERVGVDVIGNNALVVEAAAARARVLGFTPHVLTRALEGEARAVALDLVARARAAQSGRGPAAPPACLIAGGEVTVTVRGRGTGGRCQELGLAAAIALAGVEGLVLLAAGTDGTDGPTAAAGAIVDGGTVARARARGVDPASRLDDNDSHAALAAAGDLVATGPTNTNLLDLYLVLVAGPPPRGGDLSRDPRAPDACRRG